MEQPLRGKRIAFFGGSFDPPHLGHLAVARAARAALDLDTVLFAPVGAQPLKLQGATAGFADRLAMTRLAIAGEPGLAISLADAPTPSGAPNFTLETLQRLRAQLPSDGVLFCLMGADSFFSLRRWHRAAEIPFTAPLIVASRPGQRLDELRTELPEGLTMDSAPGAELTRSGVALRSCILHNPDGESVPFYILPGLNIEISASQVREWIRERFRAASGTPETGQDLLPKAVFDYIRAQELYR